MSGQRCYLIVASAILMATLATVDGRAQGSRLLPDVATFRYPMASPRVEGIVGRIFRTTVADNVLGTGSEADVRIGKIFPILALQSGPDPLHIGFGVQVSGRFSLHDPQNTFISNDWWVGFNLTKRWSAWDATVQLYHESSHLGDEYAELTGVSRQGWTREVAAGWLGYRTGALRFSGTLAYVLQGIPDLPGISGGAGIDWLGPAFWALGGPVQLVAGVFGESASQTSWQLSTMGRAGVVLGGADGRRSLAISLIAYDGVSTQRQFYQAHSRYLGGELRIDL